MIRVLVVDDDFMVARVHAGYVERVKGFEAVGQAHTAAAALEACERLRPDLVLLDIYLPDRSGPEVLRAVRTHAFPPVDVLAVTAARDVEVVRAAMQGGVVTYLIKPFSAATLKDRLERYAAARRQLRARTEADQSHVDQVFVDQVFGVLHARAQPLPKGLSQPTRDLIVKVLQEADADPGADPSAPGLSAQDVAERAGLSRVSARRYLEHLTAAGTARLTLRYGSAGRPEHRYRLADSGAARPAP